MSSEKRMHKSSGKTVIALLCVSFFLSVNGSQLFAQTPSKGELMVDPPAYAKFDKDLSKAMNEFMGQDFFKALMNKSQEAMGMAMDSMVFYFFTTDRSVSETANYYGEKLGEEVMVETEGLVESPEDFTEMEAFVGQKLPRKFIENYQKAYEKYASLEKESASFSTSDIDMSSGQMPDEWTSVEIAIENPSLDFRTWEPLEKTVIIYTVIKIKKK